MGGSSKQTTRTDNSLDPWSRGKYDVLSNRIMQLTGQPFQAYTGQLSADPSALEQNAWAAAPGAMGAGQPYFQQAGQLAGQLAGYTPQAVTPGSMADVDIDAYMNPQVEGVIGSVMSDLNRARQENLVGVGSAATQAGAWGGSRHGVAEGETNRAFADAAARAAAGIRQQAWQDAYGRAEGDIGRRFAADQFNTQAGMQGAGMQGAIASLLAQLGDSAGSAGWRDIFSLAGLGEAQRGVQQGALDRQYGEFGQQREHPWRQAEALMGIMRGTPMLTDSVSTTKSSSNAGLGSILGGALQLFPGFGQMGTVGLLGSKLLSTKGGK